MVLDYIYDPYLPYSIQIPYKLGAQPLIYVMLVKLVTFLPSVEMKSDRSCWNFQEPSGVRYCGLNTFCSCVNDGRGFANADTEKLKGLVILTALICKKKKRS